ncbi:hypothetical protein O181_013738 [Austropuccinia psidii MF-1]|uniref:Uncharacterized protein n=1 Tax=Austropuccinia psidii MF-1 TaxID=1389203 RepID=A0A9Q3GNE2_9BASI|nr:hypothetical protein [Austropuccinia psidii MF-1]
MILVGGMSLGRPNLDGLEKITCRSSSIKASRSEILKFIESFCAEAEGQKFGNNGIHELREVYKIDNNSNNQAMATHLLLELKSINGCEFLVDYSCGRYLTRPTDECNIGEDSKGGGYVADGCSLWKTLPLLKKN